MIKQKMIASFLFMALGASTAVATVGLGQHSRVLYDAWAHGIPVLSAHATKAKDFRSLMSGLKRSGMTVKRGERVSQPFFSIKGRTLTVSGESVQVFEYASARATERDAKRVEPSGSSVGTSMPMWMAPPHFYKGGRIIALYVGSDQSVIKALEDALGPQFAGK